MQLTDVKQEFGVCVVGRALRVCGLSAIQDLMLAVPSKLPDNDDKMLEAFDCNYGHAHQGNIMFAINSLTVQKYWDQPKSFYGRLLHHPGTRVIHWYKNNAHGPSLVFVFMLHRFPNEVERPDWRNNVAYYVKHLKIEGAEHSLNLPKKKAIR